MHAAPAYMALHPTTVAGPASTCASPRSDTQARQLCDRSTFLHTSRGCAAGGRRQCLFRTMRQGGGLRQAAPPMAAALAALATP